MKRIAFPLLVFVALTTHAQEFKVYNNGLIYNEQTMAQLGNIVDSLNVRFRQCDLAHPYYSLSQGLITIVKVPNAKAEQAIKDEITLEKYLQLFPQTTTKAWITRRPFSYNGEKKLLIEKIGNEDYQIADISDKTLKQNGWLLRAEKTAWFLHDIKAAEIPHEYARLIQYVDCMIDTSAFIFTGSRNDDNMFNMPEPKDNVKAKLFIEFAQSFPGQPSYNYDSIESLNLSSDSITQIHIVYSETFQVKFEKWDNARLAHLDAKVKTFPRLITWLTDGANEAVAHNNSSDELEFYVARYVSKETALKLKRGRKVFGMCSQDSRPRKHAAEICMLSAETAKWDIFLRSHLDIMNDRFDRITDGSYAWAGRKTYLHELEALDINAVDLLLGIILKVENVSDNHYTGSIARVGRALAEAENKSALEQQLFKMINDQTLDPLNRMQLVYLSSHYAYNLSDEPRKKQTFDKLEASVNRMPNYLRVGWKRWD